MLKKYELSETTTDIIATKNCDVEVAINFIYARTNCLTLFIRNTCQLGTVRGISRMINEVNFVLMLQKKWYNCMWSCANPAI